MFGRLRPLPGEGDTTTYKAAYCGLCHALKAHYGQMGTLLVTYDLAFLSLLWQSAKDCPGSLEAKCTTLPWRKVKIQSSSSTERRLLSSLTVFLACLKLSDDSQDEGSWSAKLGLRALAAKRAQARQTLEELNFPWTDLEQYLETQKSVESASYLSFEDQLTAASQPTAAITWLLIQQGGLISEQDCGHLEEFSFHLGRCIYLADAVCDYSKDLKSGSFNPCRHPLRSRVVLEKYLHDCRENLWHSWKAVRGKGSEWTELESCLSRLTAHLSFPELETQVGLAHSLRVRRQRAGYYYRWGRREECPICDCLEYCHWASKSNQPPIDLEERHEAPKSELDQKLEQMERLPILPHAGYACPSCRQSPMTRVEIGEGGLFHCQPCGGVWCNPLHLNELKAHPETRQYVTFPQAGTAPAVAPGTRACPADGEILEITRVKGVSVEECPHCESWYLDAGELGSLL